MNQNSKHYILSLLICIFGLGELKAQIQTGEYPPSFYQSKENQIVSEQKFETLKIDAFLIDSLKKDDEFESQIKDIPWRFGTVEEVDFDLTNSGEWIDLMNGTSKWLLRIKSKNALSLNLNFSQFHLSSTAKLFIYNKDYSDVIGALTQNNNKADSLFATRPLKGEEITLELHCASNQKAQNIVKVHQIVHGYRNIFEKATKSFGASGNCNRNVKCTDGERWQDVKRSVVLILRANNSRLCTGALINNVAQDSTPYVLTANHCGIQTNAVFVFNYESPNCSPNSDGVLSQSISGAALRATRSNSDFTLFELSSTPPASYDVYYAGWSAINVASQLSTTIHHPGGDVKKISWDLDSTTESGYYATGNTHWQVSNWEEGTTEGGSSGAPLFDQYQRVVGQLHGGDAACGNALQDYYGKFSQSWNASNQTNRQLKTWLDPNNTGQLTIDGLDPNNALHATDLELLNVYGIKDFSCDTNQRPYIVFKNKGSSAINYVRIRVNNNGLAQTTLNWNGNLSRNQVVEIPFSNPVFQNGTNSLAFIIDSIAPNNDLNSINDTLTLDAYVNKAPQNINLRLKTDDYGSETSWEIRPQQGSSFSIKSNPYPDIRGGRVYNQSICLYDGCFTFILSDDFGDGFNGSFGNGSLLLTDMFGDTLVFENNFTASQKTYNFCINTTSLAERKSSINALKVYPNPISRGQFLTLAENQSNAESLVMRDAMGRVVLERKAESFIVPESIESGVYFIEIRSKKSNLSVGRILVK